MKKVKSNMFLLSAALIWGMAFVFQSILVRAGMKAFNIIFYRSVFATATLFLFLKIRKKFFLSFDNNQKVYIHNKKMLLKGGIICGILMVLGCGFQQLGMQIYPQNIAVSARAAFITSMYVVMVSLFQTLFVKKPHIVVIIAVIISVIGIYFMSFSNGISGFYLGDIPLFICVIAYSVHVIVIDYFSLYDLIKLSFLQQVFSAIFSFPFAFFLEGIQIYKLKETLGAFLYMGCLSSAVAYTCQMLGQKDTEPIVAVLIMSLESVFSAIFGFLILKERMAGNEILGAFLVFISSILAQLPPLWYNIKNKKS